MMNVRLRFTDGTTRPLTKPAILGRAPDRHGFESIAVNSDALLISKNHATVEMLEQVVEITDIGSTNGTSMLFDGDRIQLTANVAVHATLPCTIDLGEFEIVIEDDV